MINQMIMYLHKLNGRAVGFRDKQLMYPSKSRMVTHTPKLCIDMQQIERERRARRKYREAQGWDVGMLGVEVDVPAIPALTSKESEG